RRHTSFSRDWSSDVCSSDLGNLICPTSTEGDGWNIHFEITPDFGKTWRKVGPIATGEDNLQGIQPSVLDHGNGTLQILARSRNRSEERRVGKESGTGRSPYA